jgi:hypothetical protein
MILVSFRKARERCVFREHSRKLLRSLEEPDERLFLACVSFFEEQSLNLQ